MPKLPERIIPVFYLVKRYKKLLGIVLLLSVTTGALENITLGALHAFLQYFFQQGIHSVEPGKYFVTLFPGRDPAAVIGILILTVLFLKNIFMIANETMIGKMSGDAMYDLKQSIMDKYSQAPYQFFLDTKYGKLSYSVLMASTRASLLMLYLPKIGAEVIKITMIMAFLVYYNWQATTVCLVVLLVYMFFIRYLSRKISYHTGKGRMEAGKEYTNIFNEFITGIKYLKIFGQTKRWVDMFNRSSNDFSRLYKKDTFWAAIPKELLEFVFFGGAIMGLLIIRSSFQGSVVNIIPSIGVYFGAMIKILPSANNIGRLHMQINNLMPDSELVYKNIHEEIEAVDYNEQPITEFRSDIKFKDVSFYHKGRDIILDKINLTIEKGKVTAIVGESGSGKSTILNLILRLFRPVKGEIAIDGRSLDSINLKSWLDIVGFVGQDTFIFNSTISENITFGGTRYTGKEVIQSARIAGIHDFVMGLPEGYGTVVGERGMKISGGQQQRVAIARAVIRDPEVLILDEATSSLDSATEKNVQQAINSALQGKTVMIVAHRLSTVEHANKIFVLKKGRIVEEGSHDQLLARRGEYRRLYTLQNKGANPQSST